MSIFFSIAGLSFLAFVQSWLFFGNHLMVFACFLVLIGPLLLILKHFKFSLISYIGMMGSLFILLRFQFSEPSNYYMYDVDAHKALISYFAKHFWPEPVGSSWLSYHPPLYYYIEGILFNVEIWLNLKPFMLVKLSSLLFYLIFQLFAIRTLEVFVKRSWLRHMCIAVISFFPVGDIYSAKVNNDSLLYPLWAGSIYFFLRWTNYRNINSLIYALVFAGLSILTKNNGFLMLLAIVVYCLIKIFNDKKSIRSVYQLIYKIRYALAFLSIACVISTGRVVFYKYFINPSAGLVVSNYNPSIESEGKNIDYSAASFLKLGTIVGVPFPETFKNDFNDKPYLPHLIKTFLYGEGERRHSELARNINSIVLALLLINLFLFIVFFKEMQLDLLCLTLPTFLFHYINVISKPVVCTADARYIFPVLIPVLLILVDLMNLSLRSNNLFLRGMNYMNVLCLLSFSCLSFYYMLSQVILV